jgi:hypothetical protein
MYGLERRRRRRRRATVSVIRQAFLSSGMGECVLQRLESEEQRVEEEGSK